MIKDVKKYGVYFANLSAYNDGRMVGEWVYPLEYKSFKNFVKAIKEATKDGVEYADEIAVHDYDSFPNMGEYPSHASIYKLAYSLEESTLKAEILIKYFNDFNFVIYSSNYEDLIDEISSIEEAFIVECDKFEDFAHEKADNEILNRIPSEAQQFVFNNFDYDGYSRDLEHYYEVITLDNYSVAIFQKV